MSTTQTTTLQERLNLIANKAGKTIAEVQTAYNEALSTLPSNLNERQKEKYALKRVNNDLNVNARSSAIAYEGVIVGVGRVRDIMKGIISNALAEYQKDPTGAVNSGLVKFDEQNQKVVVLDNRKEINGKTNKNFGKPRPEHRYVRELKIAARKPGETKFTKGKLTLWNQAANLSVPFGKLVGFKANGELEDGKYNLRSSVSTQFDIKQELPKEEIVKIIDDAFADDYKELGECLEYHRANADNWDRLVVTEGTVQFIRISNDPKVNHQIVLNDDSLPQGTRPISVWIPNELGNTIDFGRNSIVTIIAQTGLGKGYDPETKSKTDEDVLMLNALGVFGRPGMTTPPDEPGEII